jgi:hypothetical protein
LGDLEENEDILSKALERNKITHEELDGLYVLYGDILENLNDLADLETYMLDSEEAGNETKEFIYRIRTYIHAKLMDKKTIPLNKDNLRSFHNIREVNHTLLNVAKSKGIADTHFNIQGKKWINVLKAMDEGLIQKDFLRSLN